MVAKYLQCIIYTISFRVCAGATGDR